MTYLVLPIAAAGGDVAYRSSLFYPFRQVDIVSFQGPEFNDADLDLVSPHLKQLPALTFLQILHTDVTDAGLRHLKGLTHLTTLHLINNRISNAGLEHLKELSSLTTLYLIGSRISDAGLVHLKELSSLAELDLSATLISDAGLQHIEAMQCLSKLTIPGAFRTPLTEWDRTVEKIRDNLLAEITVPGFVSKPAIVKLQTSHPKLTISQTAFSFSEPIGQ